MPGVCPRCSKNVYFAEEFRFSGSCFHKMCLACTDCGKQLTPGGMLDHGGKLYCSRCYGTQFGPNCFGYGGMMVSSSPRSNPSQTPYTPPADQDRIRAGGGWVSPRLIRSTQKLLDHANIDPDICHRTATGSYAGVHTPLTPPTVAEAQSRAALGWASPRGTRKYLANANPCPENSNRTRNPGSFSSSKPTDTPPGIIQVQTKMRVPGGWVSPKLFRSKQKLDQSDSDPDHCPGAPGSFQYGGLTRVQGRPVRKVSAGSGHGVGSGGSRRHGANSQSHDTPEYRAEKSLSTTPSYRSSVPATMLVSNTKPALVLSSQSDQFKIQPQLCLRKAFNLPQYNSSVTPIPPHSSGRTSTTCPPLSGYKPKLSSLVTAPPANSCTRCGKAVYQAELARACGGVYHRSCFTCEKCGKLVSSGNLCETKEMIYCRHCYHALYGPKGVGYRIGANLQT